MTRIAFIGLGNMGGGMAARLVGAGHEVSAFDLSAEALERAAGRGCTPAASVREAVASAEAVITMLPAGPQVRAVYEGEILGQAPAGALLIDASTIDVETARAVAQKAAEAGYVFADAPVSGGTAGAEAGTLAFMVGCDEARFAAIEALLAPMARAVLRAGDHGAGQAAKICNNMLLGISMIGTCEAFALAERLPGGDRALQPRLCRRLRRGHDAEGPQAGPGRRGRQRRLHPPGRPGRGPLRPLGPPGEQRQGLLLHASVPEGRDLIRSLAVAI